jgi:predicted RNA-binding Zn ribbon-like protein
MGSEDFPDALRLVRSFANSVDVETAQDDLDSPERFGRWLVAHGFDHPAPSNEERVLAVGVRDALRDELMVHHGDGDAVAARAKLDAYARMVPLRASFGAGAAALVPAGGGAAAMLGTVLAAIVIAEHEGTWERVKICREETCQVAFYDRSKNQSKTWCSMGVCGNRNKTRSYRDRRRGVTGAAEGSGQGALHADV